jgi:hypothetical protein
VATSELQRQLQSLIDDVRLEMRDYAELNRLIQDSDGNPDVESSDKVIARTIKIVIGAFNAMPPPIATYSWDNFPDRSLLITGIVARLLRQVANLDERNYYPASDGQVGVPSRQKGQFVRRTAESMWSEFMQMAKQLKVSLNFRAAAGGLALASEEGMILLEDYLRGRIAPLYAQNP